MEIAAVMGGYYWMGFLGGLLLTMYQIHGLLWGQYAEPSWRRRITTPSRACTRSTSTAAWCRASSAPSSSSTPTCWPLRPSKGGSRSSH